MIVKKEKKDCSVIKITIEEGGQNIGRVYLYLVSNDLHAEPYGLIEDLYVEEAARGKGVGTKLVQTAIDEAKLKGCYKLIAMSRDSRTQVHALYEKNGFKKYGIEFRMEI
ncbi:MAG: hypothetical protein A2754_04030 [Candidatus Magasanikbacteria bacterium RIFCSPHIGHO2_01_FULL_47_8]|uniref:N-acetyltransferase domain-containing protein n=1 Tax=Candidatus Magasanikbacteria bacterium RIFCSPHIGHO2_01_FULL_47_8 TaxID=1798673 RepID=A0A1F6MDK4_9BACT|nr:MAG: hypothetical protein A2754_04030 [Candidatus Magasanikbacteria bacterium RIFCSPHIGHO2_01_FULL_47_8]